MENQYRASGTYTLDLEEDLTTTYQIEEHGRPVQFHKGKNGKRIITDFGRESTDLKRAFDLLGKDAIRFDHGEIVRPRKRDVVVTLKNDENELSVTKHENVTDNVNVTDKSQLSVTFVTDNQQNVTDKLCTVCGKIFDSKRNDAKYCSSNCRVKASRM